MRKTSLVFVLAVVAVLMALPERHARADQLYGTIRGRVADPSGAVIPGAKVTATNMNTGITRQATSLPDGTFIFLNLLAPATYNVTVEKGGFQKYVSRSIILNVNQAYVVMATLQVGSTTQEVTVQAHPAEINTTSMQLGTTVTGKSIVDLPLNGRDWIQLQQLQPGVVGQSDLRFNDAYSTNGAEAQQNSFLINGMDTGDIALNVPDITIPSPDAIGEFRMITNTINPEYGRNSGAIMNAVIKSGTNQLHGDGFEFFRDTTLDARSFFQQTTAPFHQNEFGGTIGGPLLIPHIYNGRNKTFFFYSYEGYRNVQPETIVQCDCNNPGDAPVFSSAERSGIFSGLATSKGTSAFPLVGDNGVTYPAGTPYSTIFPNGTIPTSDLNPLAVKLMNQYVPLPNGPANSYIFNPVYPGLDDQNIWRIDENIRSQDSLWAYGLWERHFTTQTLPFGGTAAPFGGSTLPGFTETDGDHAQEYVLDWNHIFNATTLNEVRFGYLRFNFASVYPQTLINPSSYGFTGITPQIPSEASLPVVIINGLFDLGFSTNGPQPRLQNNYDVADNFSKIIGRHAFKAGFTMDRIELFNPYNADLSGVFTFGGNGAFSTGIPGADFLLGLPDSYDQSSGSITNTRGREYYSYLQDEFKLRPNFTLTYGMGWDVETPYLNLYANGEFVNAFRPGVQSKVFPTAPPGILWPGDPGINSAGGPTTPLTDVAPRVGFAWSPGRSQNWSVHAGFGIYYNRTEEEVALQNLFTPPFTISSTGVGAIGGSPSLAAPFSGWCASGGDPVACSQPNSFPFSPPAPGAKVNFASYEPFVINTLSPNFGAPMSENYNFTVEHQISSSTTLSVAYVGNVGHHLEGAYELNPAGQAPGVNPGAAALGCTSSDIYSCDPSSFRYNPAIFGAINYDDTNLNSNYNSLQVEFNRRFTNGLQFMGAYTWSRFFDYNSTFDNQAAFVLPGLNPFDLSAMYGPSDADAPQRLVLNWDYTLPIYHFAHRLRAVTDGWKLGGIATFQHGFPVEISDSSDPSLTCNSTFEFLTVPCWDRPNRVGPLQIGNPRNYTIDGSPNYWFNPSAFASAAPGAIGDASRNPLYAPGINNWDIDLFKDFYITESKYIELRFETYDTFNVPQFQKPAGDINGSEGPFGRITSVQAGSTNGDGRVVQLSGKIYF
jgi:Carboxypeptidase regulatory-like domain